VRNLPCAQPTDEGGLQGCDARTHHPSWSSIILKSTFSITRCCFFYDASFLSFMDCIPWISWNIFMIKNISWSYSFCFLCFSLSFFSWPYLTPKWYRCTREEFVFGTQLVLLYLFVFVTVTNQKMPYTKTCDDGGYVHSILPDAVSAFLFQPSSFFSSSLLSHKDWCHNQLDAEHLGHDLPCLDTAWGHQIIPIKTV